MNIIQSWYYQFVNFIQEMRDVWFALIWGALVVVILILVVKFFKIYNGTQKNFEKVSLIVLAILLMALLIFLTCIRK